MSLKTRVAQAERKAGVGQSDLVPIIIMSHTAPDGSGKTHHALICDGPLGGTKVYARDDEGKNALSERVNRITRGLETVEGTVPQSEIKEAAKGQCDGDL